MPRPIAFDLTRLFVGALGGTPRGIDRVDLSVAHRLFDPADAPHIGLVPGPMRMGRVERGAALAITRAVERGWREAPFAAHDARDPALPALARWLASGRPGSGETPRSTGDPARVARHIASLALLARGSLLAPAVRAVPPGAVYLNTGQVLLGAPWVFGWLDRRPDVRAVFTLHDLIPMTHPEYSGPLLSRHHARALATVARRGTALLATSHASADEIVAGLRRLGRTDIPVHVVPLPVSPTLLAAGSGEPPPGPYFVTVGILDPRKNHRLLWHVWRDLLRRHGPGIPKLVAIGSRGLRTGELHDLLAHSPGLDGVVRVVSGLPSGAMRTLMAGSRGLLMPSFAEGFGLPLIEAAALGIPVVASDIPAHREATAGTDAMLLDPTDGPGWTEAVIRLAAAVPGEGRRTGPPPQTWDSYFAAVMPWLDSL